MSTLDTVFEFKLSPSEATDEETLYTTLCSLIGERLGLRRLEPVRALCRAD